jgi:ClpP class serine protease
MTRALQMDPLNTQSIVDDLDFVNGIFHKTIQDNLGISADSEVFTGAIYNAAQAVDLKLINEINTLEYAIDYAYKQGLIHKARQQYQLIKN